jgi:hypothetical protein
MQKKILATAVLVLMAVLSVWPPWLTHTYAENRAIISFNKSWEYVIDGCGTACNGCGAISSQRIPLGMLVTIEYACEMMPADLPEYHDRATAFVSVFGTVHGLPSP